MSGGDVTFWFWGGRGINQDGGGVGVDGPGHDASLRKEGYLIVTPVWN